MISFMFTVSPSSLSNIFKMHKCLKLAFFVKIFLTSAKDNKIKQNFNKNCTLPFNT